MLPKNFFFFFLRSLKWMLPYEGIALTWVSVSTSFPFIILQGLFSLSSVIIKISKKTTTKQFLSSGMKHSWLEFTELLPWFLECLTFDLFPFFPIQFYLSYFLFTQYTQTWFNSLNSLIPLDTESTVMIMVITSFHVFMSCSFLSS